MIRERKELEENLDGLITRYNRKRQIEIAIRDSIAEHNFADNEFKQVWYKNKELEDIDLPLLYLISKYMYDKTGEETINPNKFFSETEIKDGDNYKKLNEEINIKYPIVFENVLKTKDDQYIFNLPCQDINGMIGSGMLTYNFETQRSPKHKIDSQGELIKVININKQSVKEISNDLLDGNFITNCITINLLQDGADEYVYNEKKRELTILNGELNVVDGFHRCLGMVSALGINPTLEYISEIRLVNWGVDKCRSFIYQEDKKNKINRHYIQSVINTGKMGNRVVTRMNEGHGDIKGKITTDLTLIRLNRAYTMADMMANAIDYLWDIKTNMEVVNLSNYLTEFTDYIIGCKSEDFINNLELSKSKSVITYPAMFIGYMTLAKKLESVDNWQNELAKFLDTTDFSIKNEVWTNLNIINKNNKPVITVNKSNLKNIIKYFEM